MMIEEIISQLKNGTPERLQNAHLFHGVPGVYSIEEDGKLIYVGLSGNLKKRLKQHRNFNPRSSMFSYRYMLDDMAQPEPECSTKQKNKLRQQFKLEHPAERQALAEKIRGLIVRTVPLPKDDLRVTEHKIITALKPKLNRCKS